MDPALKRNRPARKGLDIHRRINGTALARLHEEYANSNAPRPADITPIETNWKKYG
jgi:hypothetical protein